MKQTRIIGLAFVVALAVSVSAVASASAALPEFSPFKKITFSTSSGPSTLETASGSTIHCTASSSEKGKIKTAKEVSAVVVEFTGCLAFGVAPCNSKGAAAEEIDTSTLTGELGYINAATKTVGIALQPKPGKPLATFECAGVKIEVTGSVIGVLTPVNTKGTTFSLAFTQTKGIQNPTKLEGEPEDVLFSAINGGTPEHAGQEGTSTLVTSAATEVIA